MILSQVKKGNYKDILIECDKQHGTSDFLAGLIAEIEAEKISIDKSVLVSPFLLNVYLNKGDTARKPKPPTKKKADVPKLKKTKSQSAMSDTDNLLNLLNKYNSEYSLNGEKSQKVDFEEKENHPPGKRKEKLSKIKIFSFN